MITFDTPRPSEPPGIDWWIVAMVVATALIIVVCNWPSADPSP